MKDTKIYFIRNLLLAGMMLKYISRKRLIKLLTGKTLEEIIKILKEKGYQYDIDGTFTKKNCC